MTKVAGVYKLEEMTISRNIILIFILAVVLTPRPSVADPMRDFVMSCSYGVLAGTLVGAATLAFSDRPGDSLNKVARGASFGLYAGILLGLYVSYGGAPEDEELPPGTKAQRLDWMLTPLVSDENNFEGALVTHTALRF